MDRTRGENDKDWRTAVWVCLAILGVILLVVIAGTWFGYAIVWTTITAIATAAYAIIAGWALWVARSQIRVYNSIRTTEMVACVYDTFVNSPEMCDLYAKIREGKKFEYIEQNLNKALTLFDKVSYLETEQLLGEDSTVWEYIASEVQYFARNESVWEYIEKRVKDSKATGLPTITMPFTGFVALLDRLPDKYQITDPANPYPGVPSKYVALYEDLKKAIRDAEKASQQSRCWDSKRGRT
jgi:hypothetical protein